jgi:hypothetical protein
MMGHRGAPGVEYRGEADLDAEVLGIGRSRAHCLRGSLEQEIVDDGLVLVGDGGKGRQIVLGELLIAGAAPLVLCGLSPQQSSEHQYWCFAECHG